MRIFVSSDSRALRCVVWLCCIGYDKQYLFAVTVVVLLAFTAPENVRFGRCHTLDCFTAPNSVLRKVSTIIVSIILDKYSILNAVYFLTTQFLSRVCSCRLGYTQPL